MKRFLFLLAFCIILFSCIFGPEDEGFSFKISVVYPLGIPVSGLNVSILNKISSEIWEDFETPSRALTTIPFAIPTDSFVELYVEDINRNRVRTLISEDTNSGFYQVFWNGRDDDGNTLISGVYYSTIKLSENNVQY
ncbi:MAG: hypothetical protein KAS53_04795 [Candidatus Cloacimonetes bacterium]|nr:hypothetical protein [Candidatus Cloacimonadota bacterium]